MDPVGRVVGMGASAGGVDAVAVVLSGALGDGSDGARLVLAAGGDVIVQDPDDAIMRGMPERTIALVDGAARVLAATAIGPAVASLDGTPGATATVPPAAQNASRIRAARAREIEAIAPGPDTRLDPPLERSAPCLGFGRPPPRSLGARRGTRGTVARLGEVAVLGPRIVRWARVGELGDPELELAAAVARGRLASLGTVDRRHRLPLGAVEAILHARDVPTGRA
jgi:hypothetical protein